VSIGLAPHSDSDAADLLARGPLGRLVAGFRGRPPLHRGALADLLHRLSALALDVPELAELDLNPILVDEHGYYAIDRRVRLQRLAPSTRVKTW
jgi:acetyltransferase